MIISYYEYQAQAKRRKRLIRLATGVVGLALFLTFTALLLLNFGTTAPTYSQASSTELAKSVGTPIRPPPATPTETPVPTQAASTDKRAAKCEDEGVGGVAQLLAHWQVGDSRTLQVTRYRQRFIRNKLKAIVQSVMQVHVNILETGPDGYTIEWLVTDAQVEKGGNATNLTVDDLFLQDLLTLKPGLRLVYRTDINGAYQQLDNWEQVLTFHHQLRDIFNLRLEKAFISKQARERLQAAIAPTWSDRAQIEQIYTQEIRAYHHLYGLQIGTNQVLIRSDRLPSLLGNMPLDARSETALSSFGPQANCAFLTVKRYLPSLSTRQLLRDYLTRQTKTYSFGVPVNDGLITTKIEDSAHYSLDMASSWLPMVQLQRQTKVENLNLLDTIMVADVSGLLPSKR